MALTLDRMLEAIENMYVDELDEAVAEGDLSRAEDVLLDMNGYFEDARRAMKDYEKRFEQIGKLVKEANGDVVRLNREVRRN